MTKLSKILFLILLLNAIRYPLNATYAAVPHLINYQGRLTDSNGVPLNGTYSITFRIYDAETAGNLLWQETHSAVVIQKGIFGILLGSVTNMDLAFDKAYFLEIKVGEEVMSPRQRIASVGYALRSEKAEMANSLDIGNVQQGDILYFDGTKWIRLGAGISGQYLKTQGAGANPVWATATGIPQNMQVFTSSGTWMRPAGVNKVWVKAWGGGGGGGYAGTGGGGGGGYAEGIVNVSSDVTVTVGKGGYCADGGDSSFIGDSTITANGGKSSSNGGGGGSASGGSINLTGGRGMPATGSGTGGGSPMGGAGGGKTPDGQTHIAGTPPGGGGGSGPGGSTSYPGPGADGLVIVYY